MRLPGRKKVDDPNAREAERFLALPRSERRVIVPLNATRSLEIDIAAKEQGAPTLRVFGSSLLGAIGAGAAGGSGIAATAGATASAGAAVGAAAGPVGFLFGGLIAGAIGTVVVRRYQQKAKEQELPKGVRFMRLPLARHLTFWRGFEPEADTVYICHPMKDEYIPAAIIDPALLSDKVREAQDLLITLGASRIEVIQDSEDAVILTAGIDGVPGASGGFDGRRQRSWSSYQVLELAGSPLPTSDPADDSERFAWYRGEPTWQDLYRHRTESRLKSSKVRLKYKANFGLDAKLKASLSDIGFAVAGQPGGKVAKVISKLLGDLNFNLGGAFEKSKEVEVSWSVQFPIQE